MLQPDAFKMQDVIRISSYDGQSVWLDFKTEMFEVGNFLGGGAAGNVYECEHVTSKEHFAIKVLNPLGFKITASSLLQKFVVVSKGEVYAEGERAAPVRREHVWWLMNSATKQYLACYFGDKGGALRELSLSQCMGIWGTDLPGICSSSDPAPFAAAALCAVPAYPPKYVDFLRKRDRIFREIRNMRKIPAHPNVIRLEAVLELAQDSKCTIFLVMELANGGELFDRIKTDCGTCEDTAKHFFWQLLQGVQHCHSQGVCHRDLKPENLLLQGDGKDSILKIADFGFSAHFAEYLPPSSRESPLSWASASPSSSFAGESTLRTLKSVVGSPYYVAPEVLQAVGYDGPKADIWSMGVILYAMLAGNLPFGHELASCKRFKQFCKWVREQTAKGVRFWDDAAMEYPQWLFPHKFSAAARGLITAMLHPDPAHRISVAEAMKHPLCAGQREAQSKQYNALLLQASAVHPPPPQQHLLMHHTHIPIPAPAPVPNASNASNASVPTALRTAAGLDNDRLVSEDPDTPMKGRALPSTDSMAMDEDQEQGSGTGRDDEDEEEVFRMEEDESPAAPAAVIPVVVPQFAFPAAPDSKFRAIAPPSAPSEAAAITTKEVQGSVFSSTAAEVPSSSYGSSSRRSTPIATPLPIVPPSYLTMPGLDDLMDADAKGVDIELDSPLLGHAHGNPPWGIAMQAHPHAPHPQHPQPQRPELLLATHSASSSQSAGTGTGTSIPEFSDRVKRSTRFLTVVPAAVVLEQVEAIMQSVIHSRTETPAGYIGRVAVDWSRYRLEVWDTASSLQHGGPAIFALQLYQMPAGAAQSMSFSFTSSPERLSYGGNGYAVTGAGAAGSYAFTPAGSASYMSPTASPGAWFASHPAAPPELFLVEFIRGQLEIFAFKRFYQYIRQRLSEFVKKDYAYKQFDPAASSPMVDSFMLQQRMMHQMA